MITAVLACILTLLSLTPITVTATRNPRSSPDTATTRVVFASLLAFVLSLACVFAFRTLAARLYRAAMRGELHH
jgi:hypothetical protein